MELINMIRSWNPVLQCFTIIFLSTVLAVCVNGTINKILSFFTYSIPVIFWGWPKSDTPSVAEVIEKDESEDDEKN